MDKKLKKSRCVSGKSNNAERTESKKVLTGQPALTSKLHGLDEELKRIMRTRRPRSYLVESSEQDERPPGQFFLASEREANLEPVVVDDKEDEESLAETEKCPITTRSDDLIAVNVQDRLVNLDGRHFLIRELDPVTSDREGLQVDKEELRRMIQRGEDLRKKYCGCHPVAPQPKGAEDELWMDDPEPVNDDGVPSSEPATTKINHFDGAERPERYEKVKKNCSTSNNVEPIRPESHRNLNVSNSEAKKKQPKSDDVKDSGEDLEVNTAKETPSKIRLTSLQGQDEKLTEKPPVQKKSCPVLLEDIPAISPTEPTQEGDEGKEKSNEKDVEVEPEKSCGDRAKDKKPPKPPRRKSPSSSSSSSSLGPKLVDRPSKSGVVSSADRYVKPRKSGSESKEQHRTRKPSGQNATCRDCILSCGCAEKPKEKKTLVRNLDLAPKFKTEQLPHGVILHIKFSVHAPTGLTRDVHAIFDMPNYQLRRIVVDGAEYYRV
ncbi:unnamed protein product [Bursaphelenchus xylophilus]|uniref:(pine wood nematode) hypothetical protein n=1 Tax=Bursaphelenchus xylophilus TaxID=6326 RepID=A0A7I8XF96_BURXY|nr:unnamed protein product [Bursaphelenchus xylophilus]CAG9080359.1 unnamed protein product [Bursaphelenchus xylophilus]